MSPTAARTLQEFLITADWDHERVRNKVQRQVAAAVAAVPDDDLGTVGVIDETSGVKGTRRRACSASTWGAWARSTAAS